MAIHKLGIYPTEPLPKFYTMSHYVHALIFAGSLFLYTSTVNAQNKRFYTTTAISVAFPVGKLAQVTQPGLGTSFGIEYQLRPRLSIAGAWDSNSLTVQTAKLVTNLNPALMESVSQLKGRYKSNVFSAYVIGYAKKHTWTPYVMGGAGLNLISVPRVGYDPNLQLLSFESASSLTILLSAGVGIDWQFSKSASAFVEGNSYFVPFSSPVASNNSYLAAKLGFRFPFL